MAVSKEARRPSVTPGHARQQPEGKGAAAEAPPPCLRRGRWGRGEDLRHCHGNVERCRQPGDNPAVSDAPSERLFYYPSQNLFCKGELALAAAGAGPLWSARGLAELVSGCFEAAELPHKRLYINPGDML